MKKISFSLFVFIFFFAISTFAQSAENEIKQILTGYGTTYTAKNFDEVVDYMHPELFEDISKEDLAKGMKDMFANPDLPVSFSHFQIKEISKIYKYKKKRYAKATYIYIMTMHLSEEETADKEGLDMLLHLAGVRYGEKNVKYNDELKGIDITNVDAMYAIKDSALEDWKFIQKGEGVSTLIRKVIPEKVLKKLIF